jgi:hypothetical protein
MFDANDFVNRFVALSDSDKSYVVEYLNILREIDIKEEIIPCTKGIDEIFNPRPARIMSLDESLEQIQEE